MTLNHVHFGAKNHFFRFILLIVASAFFSLGSAQAKEWRAKGVLESFYKKYLNSLSKPSKTRPSLVFSKSFRKLWDEDRAVCRKYAGTDVCGWDVGSDIYLNTQETDPKLTYNNSRISYSEAVPGKVLVKFNVYPTDSNAGKFYEREVLYQMVYEGGTWVVDDIFYKADSARKQMRREIDLGL